MAGLVKENGAPEIDGRARAREALRPHAATIRSMCETRNFDDHPLYLRLVAAVADGGDPAKIVAAYNNSLTS